MDAELPKTAIAEILANGIATLDPARLPPAVRTKCEELLIDVVGLCLTARNEDYVKARWRAGTTTVPAPRSAMRGVSARPALPSSTAPPRTARISTTPSRAGPCMPAR
jgi:hypothetical protein